jgi:hypothetical protein
MLEFQFTLVTLALSKVFDWPGVQFFWTYEYPVFEAASGAVALAGAAPANNVANIESAATALTKVPLIFFETNLSNLIPFPN